MTSNRSFLKRLWYGFLHLVCRLLAVVAFRVRIEGREHLPASGGVLVLANHQSHFDPVLIGLASRSWVADPNTCESGYRSALALPLSLCRILSVLIISI